MERSLLVRSILAGLAGVIILVVMMAVSGFMADQAMKEYYKVPRGYDNDFVGFEWIIFFFFGALGTFAFTGALAAWAVRDRTPSIKDTLKASAISGTVPVVLIIIGAVALAIIMFAGNMGQASRTVAAAIELVLLSPMIVGITVACIVLSLIGGLAYTMLIRPLKRGRMAMPSWKTPLLIGIAGGAIILAFHVADVVLNHGVYSFAWGQAGVLVFFAITLSFGALVARRLKSPGVGLAGILQASSIAGLVMGLSRTIGCELGAVVRNYNQAGILFSDGIPGVINGMILAAIGGLIYVAFAWKTRSPADGDATGKSLYSPAVGIGLLAGFGLAILAIIPAMAYIASSLSGSRDTYIYITTITMIGSMMGFLVTVAVLVAEGILAVRYSPVKSLNDSMAVAAIAGALTGIVSTGGDIINQVSRTFIFTSASSDEPYYSDVVMANLMSALGCAPLKVVVMITVCVMVAIIYSIWLRGLKYQGNGGMR